MNLRPAEMDVILHERVTKNTWSATVIDLAVRGYLKIAEEEKTKLQKVVNLFKKDYIVTPTDLDVTSLTRFEKDFLEIFTETLSTKQLRKDQILSRRIYHAVREAEKLLYIQVGDKRGLYFKTIDNESKKIIGIVSLFTIVTGSVVFFESLLLVQILVFGLTCLIVGTFIYFFIKYEARLSDKGNKVKEEILGFKLYLKTAERYRLQNLTPDLFEKFLPYAMVFGVEKEWGKAFASLSVPPPSWYSGAYGGATMGSSSISSSGFSAGAFSSSFSSSFSSAFSSSGASGGSGGGGSAGGGGGGGGGGAS